MNAFVKTEIWPGIFNELLFCAVNVTCRIYGHGFDRNTQEGGVDQDSPCGIEFRDKAALGGCILVKDGLCAGVGQMLPLLWDSPPRWSCRLHTRYVAARPARRTIPQ